MNQVILIGRLTRDPELSYTPSTQMAVCRFTLAVDRRKGRDGADAGADFIRITVWDRQAETCSRYLSKGRQVAVQGRITTGSYKNREGVTVYTTEVTAERVEFLGGAQGGQNQSGYNQGFGGGQNNYGGGQNSFGGQSQGGNYGGQNNYGGGQSGFGSQNSFGGQSQSSFGSTENKTGFASSQSEQASEPEFGATVGTFEGFGDLPDSFQAAEDDIPF
jgi:single-strand DNA-binding protein